jgi:tRNA modification GTPase
VNDTIAAIATPEGSGAIGIVRVSGPQATAVACRLLRRQEPPESRRARLVRVHDGAELLDEALAVFFKAPHSYTGEDTLELSCHGSTYLLRRVLEAAIKAGARQAAPGEFTQRAFLNGRLDLAQAEGVLALVSSRTSRAHRLAMAQLSGGFSRKVARLKESVLDLIALGEADLDHPDEGIPVLAPREARRRLEEIDAEIGALLDGCRRGRLLREGARIAIGGRPNAGKSSLFNALLGADRAIVCADPGTTRDALEESVDIDGLLCVLTDTAGLRPDALSHAERAGIERGETALKAADLVLFVIDGSEPPCAEDGMAREAIEKAARMRGVPVLRVINKSDVGTHEDWRAAGGVPVSAKTGTGLSALRSALLAALSVDSVGEAEAAASASMRQIEDIQAAHAELQAACGLVAREGSGLDERHIAHLRSAFEHLGLVVGKASPDEILDAVFSRFCVGK